MTETESTHHFFSALHETKLGEALCSYIDALTKQAPESFVFRTGAGRMLRDLMLHWPILDGLENEALELCNRAVEALYPLVASLFARGVEISVTISPTRIAPPDRVDATASYILFDPIHNVERHCVLTPDHAMSHSALSVPQGIVIMCKPLQHYYHTIKDTRRRTAHPMAGIFEFPERMIDELCNLGPFVPHEKKILAELKYKIHEMAKRAEASEVLPEVKRSEPHKGYLQLRPTDPVTVAMLSRSVNKLAGSGLIAQSIIRLLMFHALQAGHSELLRWGVRRTAKEFRNLYPQFFVEEAAYTETTSRHAQPHHATGVSVSTAPSARELDRAAHALSDRLTPSLPKSASPSSTGSLNKAALTQNYEAALRRLAARRRLASFTLSPYPTGSDGE